MYHAYDFVDGFRALFGGGNVLFPKRTLPLGAATVDVLNLDEQVLEDLERKSVELQHEIDAYLSGDYDPSQAGFTNQAMDAFFSLLSKLPVYAELETKHTPSVLILRRYPEVRERMRTEGLEEHTQLLAWQRKLRNLVPSLRAFQERAALLLENYFSEVEDRSAAGYAKCLSTYFTHVQFEHILASDALDDEELTGGAFELRRQDYRQELDRRFFPAHFPVEITYRTVPHPKEKGAYLLAEEVFFEDVGAFLSLDLMRGLAAGHLPRRCAHCGRWFLLESGYDTRYCENPAPGEPNKTCRQVGAHRREVRLNGTEDIRVEYRRVTNRLKGQKHRGTLSTDEWNRWMRQVQDLRDDAINGRIKAAELKKRYDQISMRREKI